MKHRVITIVQQLSRYLSSHPQACDTPEGIAHWWGEGDAVLPVADVESALAWLAACGIVESLTAADGRVRFRRAGGASVPERLAAMAADARAVKARGKPPQVH